MTFFRVEFFFPFLSFSFLPILVSFSRLKKVRLRDPPSLAGPGSTTFPLYKDYLRGIYVFSDQVGYQLNQAQLIHECVKKKQRW